MGSIMDQERPWNRKDYKDYKEKSSENRDFILDSILSERELSEVVLKIKERLKKR